MVLEEQFWYKVVDDICGIFELSRKEQEWGLENCRDNEKRKEKP